MFAHVIAKAGDHPRRVPPRCQPPWEEVNWLSIFAWESLPQVPTTFGKGFLSNIMAHEVLARCQPLVKKNLKIQNQQCSCPSHRPIASSLHTSRSQPFAPANSSPTLRIAPRVACISFSVPTQLPHRARERQMHMLAGRDTLSRQVLPLAKKLTLDTRGLSQPRNQAIDSFIISSFNGATVFPFKPVQAAVKHVHP